MIVQKDSTAVYLGWKEHSEAKLLVRLLTSTFPRNYLDFLLVSLVRDKIEFPVHMLEEMDEIIAGLSTARDLEVFIDVLKEKVEDRNTPEDFKQALTEVILPLLNIILIQRRNREELLRIVRRGFEF